jgi:hypothetical protein
MKHPRVKNGEALTAEAARLGSLQGNISKQ